MTLVESILSAVNALWRTSTLVEFAVIAVAVGLAWVVVRLLRPAGSSGGVLFGRRIVDGVLFPLAALALVVLARWWMLRHQWPAAILGVTVPLLTSLAVIRVTVQVLHNAFPTSRLVAMLERTVSWGVWLLTALWVLGWMQPLLAEADAISWRIGGESVTLRGLLEGTVTAVGVLIGSLWLSAAIEARLRAAQGVHLSVRKIASNATRAALLFIGLLVALSAAGIPLGALSVLGGALGVGIGFGLQKLAANYVSGFVILAERSLRIGDLVAVDNFEGRITDITTRCTVIRSPTGREAIVPNEMLITQRVDNLTYADSKLVQTTRVQVGYETDLDALFPKVLDTLRGVPRVLSDPEPTVRLSAFADSGLELTIAFWIGDPANGLLNVVGDVNLAILRLFNAEGIEIPYPQRVMRTLVEAAPAATPAAAQPRSDGDPTPMPPN
jgi:small-conductance mechanosensitive channel